MLHFDSTKLIWHTLLILYRKLDFLTLFFSNFVLFTVPPYFTQEAFTISYLLLTLQEFKTAPWCFEVHDVIDKMEKLQYDGNAMFY